MMRGVRRTYEAVDDSPDPHGAADWQERMARWPAIRAYKAHTYRLLAGVSPVVDVGCGPGVDVAALGPRAGASIGVDPSTTMCRRARRSGLTVCRGAAEALPFGDATLGGCRTDRVLQHARDPVAAVQEMVRVTRPGGVVVAA